MKADWWSSQTELISATSSELEGIVKLYLYPAPD